MLWTMLDLHKHKDSRLRLLYGKYEKQIHISEINVNFQMY